MRYTISRKLMAISRRRGHESTYLGINSCTLELWYLFYFMHNFALLEVLSIFSERMISFEVLSTRVKATYLRPDFSQRNSSRCLHTGHVHLPAVHHPHVRAYPGMSCIVYCNQTFIKKFLFDAWSYVNVPCIQEWFKSSTIGCM